MFLRSSSASSSVADRCTSITAIDNPCSPFPLFDDLSDLPPPRAHTHPGQMINPHATSTFQQAPSSISSSRSVAADDDNDDA